MLRRAFVSILLCAGASVGHAGDCSGLDKALHGEARADSKMGWLLEAARAAFQKDPPNPKLCGSLSSVIRVAMGGAKQGGRRLEDDRPVSPAAAQGNVDEAMANPHVRELLDTTPAADASTRLMYEAAIFDWGGYYAARDLRIAQLRQKAR